jgi:hypothetical protein
METIKPITSLTQLQEASKLPMQPLMPFSNEKPNERLESARAITNTILSRYPDYTKATPEYTAGIMMVIATFPIIVQNQLASIRGGISSICDFLPTQASIIKLGERFEVKAIQDAENNAKPRVRVYEGSGAWEAWQKKRGSTPCVEIRDENNVLHKGWYFPTEFP